jgi:hypothetical protein
MLERIGSWWLQAGRKMTLLAGLFHQYISQLSIDFQVHDSFHNFSGMQMFPKNSTEKIVCSTAP